MKKKDSTRNTTKQKLEILESDDELPDSYEEIPDLPAYEDDHRFDRVEPIEFMWLQKKLEDRYNTCTPSGQVQEKSNANSEAENQKQQIDQQELYICKQTEYENGEDQWSDLFQNFLGKKLPVSHKVILKINKEGKTCKKIRISKGVLTKRDIFFIKSIEQYTTDSTLLWFIDFLQSKDTKPIQRSCLVSDITKDHYLTTEVPLAEFNRRYTFEIIVNN